MKITVLGSGSTGNAVLICTEKTRVLIDAGLEREADFNAPCGGRRRLRKTRRDFHHARTFRSRGRFARAFKERKMSGFYFRDDRRRLLRNAQGNSERRKRINQTTRRFKKSNGKNRFVAGISASAILISSRSPFRTTRRIISVSWRKIAVTEWRL